MQNNSANQPTTLMYISPKGEKLSKNFPDEESAMAEAKRIESMLPKDATVLMMPSDCAPLIDSLPPDRLADLVAMSESTAAAMRALGLQKEGEINDMRTPEARSVFQTLQALMEGGPMPDVPCTCGQCSPDKPAYEMRRPTGVQ